MPNLAKAIEKLTITQGAGVGKPFHVMPWQRRFLAKVERGGDGALSIARGNGKTTLVAAIAHEALRGCLAIPRGETVITASSFGQATIAFDHIIHFLKAQGFETRPSPRDQFLRIRDSQNFKLIEWKPTGAFVKCIASDPRRAHGLAPRLVLADEPAQWETQKSDKMLSALRTSLGKVPDSQFIALGTRPSDPDHWFSKMLSGEGAAFTQCHDTAEDDKPFRAATWRKANPSLPLMPNLLKRIRTEAAHAKKDGSLLPGFRALRLNQGTADSPRSHLLDSETWKAAEGDLPREGQVVWGADLGTTAAMSATACVWESGRLEVFAALPSIPTIEKREIKDQCPGLYSALLRAEELCLLGGRVVPVNQLLEASAARFCASPVALAADRWRIGELEDSLSGSSLDPELVERGQGFKDGAEDVRRFREAILSGAVRPVKSLLARAAMKEAVVVSDPAGNEKLAKSTEAGRRKRGRDDAASAAIMAVAEFMRRREAPADDGECGHAAF